jgi:asparagine synthase (glutamine-hydrolysing)
MCGIAGLLAPSLSPSELQRIADLLAHRGPDDAGYYFDDGVGLAARRLSIIDLAGGRQPLSNEDGSAWLVYNGEVYNAPVLRAELEAAGHRFSTRTDTETIVHAYEQWGDDAVVRLRGMFAFALWDAPRRRLLLARDRFGVKPLYYAECDGRFAFASEIRPILAALPQLPKRADREALWHLFSLGFIPSPLTAFEGIHELPAAHTLVVENRRVSLRRYWQLTYPPDGRHRRVDPQAAAQEFALRLREAVDAWRLSDVPVGSLLSGGVDSASLAALLTEISGGPIHTFSIGFAAASHDESSAARETARALGSRHHELTFSTADFDHLPQVVRHLEEPQCSATSAPIYLLYKACHAAGFKVIMTGEGADELLGGYHWFDGDRRARPLLRLPQPIRALIARAPIGASPAARRVIAHGTRDPVQRYWLWQQVGSSAQLAALLRIPPPLPTAEERLGGNGLSGLHSLDQFLYLESTTRMVDFINFEVDRMSMASSVEARPPFLDHHLWEFCAGLPPDCKLGPAGDKLLLRLGMKDRLPAEVARRPKRGLATPHDEWWRGERLPTWAEDCLHPTALSEANYFDAGEVARLRAAHRAGRVDAARLLMGVLTTQLWHEAFVR